ncbi:Uncharacterized protein TCM_003905 [Theobroma cacao]|uniref:Uncharacterized protein n=1 Tax=Theobroma cacao TaxID=3641 RepID=A0A061DND6_THECC|nr:Uncharacterized protein TCM_003905 [Theobroma cacao]
MWSMSVSSCPCIFHSKPVCFALSLSFSGLALFRCGPLLVINTGGVPPFQRVEPSDVWSHLVGLSFGACRTWPHLLDAHPRTLLYSILFFISRDMRYAFLG